jgi:predicted RNA methylase
MLRLLGRSAVAALLLFVAATVSRAQQVHPQTQPRTRADCEAAHPSAWGKVGKDVPWVPTFDAVILAMLSIAQVTPHDRVLDLGAGDGRIAIAAAKPPFGASATGIEYDPELAKLASCLVEAEGVADRVRIVEGDIFKESFGGASVVTMFLLPHLNLCVRHRLLALPPGTRVVSHQYAMGDWKPDQSVNVQGRDVHMWVVPSRVDAVWDFHDSQQAAFAVDLRQSFEAVTGEITRGGAPEPLASATLRGRELRFAVGAGPTAGKFSGTVHGSEITGVLSTGSTARNAVGTLRGALRSGAWTEMPPDCKRYYGR